MMGVFLYLHFPFYSNMLLCALDLKKKKKKKSAQKSKAGGGSDFPPMYKFVCLIFDRKRLALSRLSVL